MGVTKFLTKVADKTNFNSKFSLVHLELIEPHRIEFLAGQYIMLKVPNVDKTRDYSVVSNPKENHKIELLVDISPQGEATKYLSQIKIGDSVRVVGPAGRFVLEEDREKLSEGLRGGEKEKDTEETLVFIATGSGISPFKAMISELLVNRNDQRPIQLFWGLRYAQDLFWEDDFYQLSEEHPNFKVDITLSKPPENWNLCKGHVTDCLVGHPRKFNNTGFYICGNKGMIEDAVTLLGERGVKEGNIHHEEFY